ncbi:MAG: hypothetical protein NW226_05455 [Microscillaceae bacterium]|nr:hypothetical protein [Microscillaceae bacterium]
MKRFYEFIKSPQAPVFALATMILTFFQMYAKLYYHHNPYSLNNVLDILIALIAAGGLSTITFIIIVHSKKKWMPMFFATLDFVGGLLFYGKDILVYYENGAFIEIGSALFIPFFKASAIYFVGEIFLEEVNSKQDHELSQKTTALHEITTQYETERKTNGLLRTELENLQQDFQKLKKESKEWKQKSTKYDISNVKRALYNTTNQDKKQEKERELQRLEELLEGINLHPNGNGHAGAH